MSKTILEPPVAPDRTVDDDDGSAGSRRILIGGLVVAGVALLIATYLALGRSQAPGAAPPPTAIATPEPIIAAGVVVPAQRARLGFVEAGRLVELPAVVGNKVRAGDLLARIDDREARRRLNDAETSLALNQALLDQIASGPRPQEVAAAEAEVAAATARLDLIRSGPTEADLTQARQAVESARAQLASAKSALEQHLGGPTASQRAAAEAGVARAQAELALGRQRLDDLRARPRPEDVRAAELALEEARNARLAAQVDRDGACGADNQGYQCKAANARVNAAETAVSAAAFALDQAKRPARPDEISAAEAAVTAAEASLASARRLLESTAAGPNAPEQRASVAAARSAVDTAAAAEAAAQARLAQLQNGPRPEETRAAAADVDRARARLDLLKAGAAATEIEAARQRVAQAEGEVAAAREALGATRLVAPFDGVIGEVTANLGEATLPGQTIVTVGDPTRFQIETTDLDETSVGSVAEGHSAMLTFDALPGHQVPARVVRVSPMATSGQGGTNFTLTIEPTEPDPALRWGMSATVELPVDQPTPTKP